PGASMFRMVCCLGLRSQGITGARCVPASAQQGRWARLTSRRRVAGRVPGTPAFERQPVRAVVARCLDRALCLEARDLIEHDQVVVCSASSVQVVPSDQRECKERRLRRGLLEVPTPSFLLAGRKCWTLPMQTETGQFMGRLRADQWVLVRCELQILVL